MAIIKIAECSFRDEVEQDLFTGLCEHHRDICSKCDAYKLFMLGRAYEIKYLISRCEHKNKTSVPIVYLNDHLNNLE